MHSGAGRGSDAQRQPFRQLRALFTDLQARGLPVDTLSMGMSHDLEAAIAEGRRSCVSARQFWRQEQTMKITFLGGGNMANALIGGLVGRGSPPAISASSN